MLRTETPPLFDDLTGAYDALVDWSGRLAREEPFFRKLFRRHRVRRVADVACGPGHHAAMFHAWGLDVEGSDISPAMLAQCRRLHGESERLRWVERSFTERPAHPGGFDAVVCVGNSLALTEGVPAMELAVRSMVESVRPGGVGVVQLLNLWAIPEGPTVWRKARRWEAGGHGGALVKGVHRQGTRGFVDLLEIALPEGEPLCRVRSFSFQGLRQGQLRAMVQAAGGESLAVHGGYDEQPYAQERSPDLILTWRRSP